jgi:ferredoxin-NADP reductase
MKLTFIRREQLAPGIWQHFFQPERWLDFEPGQYVDVSLPGLAHLDDPRGQTRTFTLTSLPSDDQLAFITKDFDPVSAYKEALHGLEAGDAARCTDSMGDMVLPMDSNMPLVFVAGGIAIASYVSILNSLAVRGEQRDITLLYSVRYRNQAIFRESWQQPVVGSSKLFISPQRLTPRDILADAKPDSQIYLSGSEHFVEDLHQQLHAHGIPGYRIVFDFYEGYSEQQI